MTFFISYFIIYLFHLFASRYEAAVREYVAAPLGIELSFGFWPNEEFWQFAAPTWNSTYLHANAQVR